MARTLICGAIFLSLSIQLAFTSEADQPGCVWKGMRQREAELIEPCNRALENKDLSSSARAEAFFTRGRAYHNLMLLESALQDFNQALQLTPNDVDILVSRSNVFKRLGEHTLELQDLAKAIELSPDHTDLLISLGNNHHRSGDFNRAIWFFSRAIHIDPNKTFAFILRKDTFLKINNLDKALGDANEAVRAAQLPDQPNYFEDGIARNIHVATLVERARLLQKMGSADQAEKDYESAVALDKSGYALTKRAQFSKQNTTASLNDLREALLREPNNTTALYTLGALLMNEERFDDAFLAFSRSIEIDPDDACSLRQRALLLRRNGQTEAAVQDFKRAIILDRNMFVQAVTVLRRAGYWHSTEAPPKLTGQLEDALRACMTDTTCE